MGFSLNINNILRVDSFNTLEIGKEYPFEKDGLHILADGIQIWLTKKDWAPLAEILITSQTRANGKTNGTFIIKYLYNKEEQISLFQILKRMYGWS